MSKFLFYMIPALLFFSCAGEPAIEVLKPTKIPEAAETPLPYIIADHKNRAGKGSIPKWVNSWLEGGISEVETLDSYVGRYVFISRNEGNNFNALTQWAEGFNAELDFPRLAAARIEARFLSGVSHPDHEYGPFFEALIRAASDAPWTGVVREDDFWLLRRSFHGETSIPDMPATIAGQASALPDLQTADYPLVTESWEFLILVTIEKPIFASQLSAVFQNVKPDPLPTRDQVNAANRVKERFYDGF